MQQHNHPYLRAHDAVENQSQYASCSTRFIFIASRITIYNRTKNIQILFGYIKEVIVPLRLFLKKKH